MDYQPTTYKLGPNGMVIRLPDYASIPADPANSDYRAYQDWLAAGNEPEPADTPSLAAQQADVWSAIKAKRVVICGSGVEVATATGVLKWFQTDDTSRLQYLGLKDTARDMLAAGHAMSDALQLDGQAVNWKTYDNAFVALTLQNAFDIVAAVKTLDAQAFANAETHHAAMIKAADPTMYDYSTGWPTIYTGA